MRKQALKWNAFHKFHIFSWIAIQFFIFHAPPRGEIDLLTEVRVAPPGPKNGGANEFGAKLSLTEVFSIHVTLDTEARSSGGAP